MRGLPAIKRFTVVTGHYGCGKTNLSLNLALDLAAAHGAATLVDLDIVNPYFRSSDYAAEIAARGVNVISPTFAGTTLETPSLSGAVASAFEVDHPVIFDVGGDDAGATALGRYADQITAIDHDMLYVVNAYRNLTATPSEAARVLREIESVCGLTATGVVNNSHLRDETTADTILAALPYGYECAALLGIPLVCTTFPKRLDGEFSHAPGEASFVEKAYPVVIHVRTPWEDHP